MASQVFRLATLWRVPAPAERVWAVLADPGFTWPEWWPGLSAEAVGALPGPDGFGAPGSWVKLRVRSPLGGTLRFRLYLTETRPPSPDLNGRAKLQVSGDLRGTATVHVTATADDGSEVRLIWVVVPRRGVAAWTARVAPRLATWAHAHVMSAGERGLRARLTRAGATR